MKRPLIDILGLWISPSKLVNELGKCDRLLSGEFKLNYYQLKKCCYRTTDIPDYEKFDVTLLCKLIKALCPRKQKQDWRNKLTQQELNDLHDAVDQIRQLRNEHFGHAKSASISDEDFEKLWNDAERIINFFQGLMISRKKKTDYKKELIQVQEKKTWTFDEYTFCKERSKGKA